MADLVAPFLGLSPSFMYSALVPALCTLTQAAVEYLPAVPQVGGQDVVPIGDS